MKSRIWLILLLFVGVSVAPQAASAQDSNNEKFRTILLQLKGNKVDEETVNIISSLVTANLANYEVLIDN